MKCVDSNEVICSSVQTVQLHAPICLLVVETKIELDLHAHTCVVGDYFLVICDHKRPVNAFGYDPKAGSKHAHIVNAAVAYTEP